MREHDSEVTKEMERLAQTDLRPYYPPCDEEHEPSPLLQGLADACGFLALVIALGTVFVLMLRAL